MPLGQCHLSEIDKEKCRPADPSRIIDFFVRMSACLSDKKTAAPLETASCWGPRQPRKLLSTSPFFDFFSQPPAMMPPAPDGGDPRRHRFIGSE